MIQLILEHGGAVLGGLITLSLFVLNIVSLIRGKRVFRAPRPCRVKLAQKV